MKYIYIYRMISNLLYHFNTNYVIHKRISIYFMAFFRQTPLTKIETLLRGEATQTQFARA